MPAKSHRSLLKALLFSVYAIGFTFAPPNTNANEPSERFFKIDRNGQRLAAENTEWQCIEDSNTNLYWQKRDPGSALHDVNETYNWYQPERENPGQPRSAPSLFGFDISCYGYREDDPSTYCNTHAYVERVNQSNYCGFDNWRLPTVDELLSLTENSIFKVNNHPAPSPDYFPFYDPFVYWTSSVDDSNQLLTVINGSMVLNTVEREHRILIRLVRDSD